MEKVGFYLCSAFSDLQSKFTAVAKLNQNMTLISSESFGHVRPLILTVGNVRIL